MTIPIYTYTYVDYIVRPLSWPKQWKTFNEILMKRFLQIEFGFVEFLIATEMEFLISASLWAKQAFNKLNSVCMDL